MTTYRFVTVWRIEASLARVCDAIHAREHWPCWWKGVEKVEKIATGDENGIGSIARYTWKSVLPYRLTFDVKVTHVEPMVSIEGKAMGELEGIGRWTFSSQGGCTTVRYEWHVRTTKRWMNWLAPLARPLFGWNHHAVMQQGGIGLARLLNARLIESIRV
jgi:hypothetical protein